MSRVEGLGLGVSGYRCVLGRGGYGHLSSGHDIREVSERDHDDIPPVSVRPRRREQERARDAVVHILEGEGRQRVARGVEGRDCHPDHPGRPGGHEHTHLPSGSLLR